VICAFGGLRGKLRKPAKHFEKVGGERKKVEDGTVVRGRWLGVGEERKTSGKPLSIGREAST